MSVTERDFLPLSNGQAVMRAAVPCLELPELQDRILRSVFLGQRVASCFAVPADAGDATIYVVLADDENSALSVACAKVVGPVFPALTPHCPQMHLFEREIAEQTGFQPQGHPWLKPVRYEACWLTGEGGGRDGMPQIGLQDFYALHGAQVHEVAVGPVHAGIIEPGHFRFQCHGEEVFHLEISLGYQHRGVERALAGVPDKRRLLMAETIAGDTTIGHALAYCQVLEALGGGHEPPRAQALRAIALELERIANHIGDLGAMAGDVGFLPTSAYCGRIRGDALNMTAQLCGSRFGRGLLTPGGVNFDVDAERTDELSRRLDVLEKDITNAVNLLWETPSVMARFENTGVLSEEMCEELGIVGPVARAAGLSRDVRVNQPFGLYNYVHLPTSTWETGDVFARAYVRWMEIQQAILFLREQLHSLPGGKIRLPVGTLAAGRFTVSLTEGWRGEICHAALTDETGALLRYKVVDPSFHNWPGLAFALRGQQISNFPLCNKSFNLSYCGHDL